MKKILMAMMAVFIAVMMTSAAYAAEINPPVTGIIIDCSGLGLMRAQTACLYDEDGNLVYGLLKQGDSEFEFRLINGVVMYSRNVEKAKIYAGNNPLIIKAKTLKRFNWDPVITAGDARKIAEAAKTSDFHKHYKVVFVQ